MHAPSMLHTCNPNTRSGKKIRLLGLAGCQPSKNPLAIDSEINSGRVREKGSPQPLLASTSSERSQQQRADHHWRVCSSTYTEGSPLLPNTQGFLGPEFSRQKPSNYRGGKRKCSTHFMWRIIFNGTREIASVMATLHFTKGAKSHTLWS